MIQTEVLLYLKILENVFNNKLRNNMSLIV